VLGRGSSGDALVKPGLCRGETEDRPQPMGLRRPPPLRWGLHRLVTVERIGVRLGLIELPLGRTTTGRPRSGRRGRAPSHTMGMRVLHRRQLPAGTASFAICGDASRLTGVTALRRDPHDEQRADRRRAARITSQSDQR